MTVAATLSTVLALSIFAGPDESGGASTGALSALVGNRAAVTVFVLSLTQLLLYPLAMMTLGVVAIVAIFSEGGIHCGA